MTPGQALKLAGQIGEVLTKDGVLDASGNFVNPGVPKDVLAGIDIVKLLEADGVAIPVDVDKVIEALPALLSLLGFSFGVHEVK